MDEAIYTSSLLTIENCIFKDIYAQDGWTIFSYIDMTVKYSLFNSNLVNNAKKGSSGGAIHIDSPLLTIGCVFKDNSADSKGGEIHSTKNCNYRKFHI